MIFNYLINPVADIHRHTKSTKIVENIGVGFTVQQVMDTVLEYARVPVTIYSYAKYQSYSKATGTPSDPNDIRRSWRRSVTAYTSST